VGELDDPVVAELPLRGEWLVERTPADRIPSHGTDLLGQRYAYDLIRTDHRRGIHVHPAGTLRWLLLGGRTQDCYGWGQPVHAALDGVGQRITDSSGARQRQVEARLAAFADDLSPAQALDILRDTAVADLPIYRCAADDPDDENTLATAVFILGATGVEWSVHTRAATEMADAAGVVSIPQ